MTFLVEAVKEMICKLTMILPGYYGLSDMLLQTSWCQLTRFKSYNEKMARMLGNEIMPTWAISRMGQGRCNCRQSSNFSMIPDLLISGILLQLDYLIEIWRLPGSRSKQPKSGSPEILHAWTWIQDYFYSQWVKTLWWNYWRLWWILNNEKSLTFGKKLTSSSRASWFLQNNPPLQDISILRWKRIHGWFSDQFYLICVKNGLTWLRLVNLFFLSIYFGLANWDFRRFSFWPFRRFASAGPLIEDLKGGI